MLPNSFFPLEEFLTDKQRKKYTLDYIFVILT